jgi:acetoin utilization deacetylase AcuC-like enzyme
MSGLLMVEQRESSPAAQPWVLDESGHRLGGHDHDRRLGELRAGLARHAGVRSAEADASREQVEETLGALHERAFVRALAGVSSTEPVLMERFAAPGMTADTPVSAELAAAAFEGVRTAITAARRIVAGERYAYALCRPPGHHAGPGWHGGSCYLNNAAAAAQTLRDAGLGPIGILDLDIHYPNGTSAIAARMSDTRLCSLHASPVVNSASGEVEPRTARERLVAFHQAPTETEYLEALTRSLELLTRSTNVIVLSLGYDTVAGDPHGCWSFSPPIFTAIGRLLADTGLAVCVVQEGGYALGSLAACSDAFAGGLLTEEER